MTWSCQSRPTSTNRAPIPISATHLSRRCNSGSAGPLPEPGPEECRINMIASGVASGIAPGIAPGIASRLASWRQALERRLTLAVGAGERGVDPAEHLPDQRPEHRGRERHEYDVTELDG